MLSVYVYTNGDVANAFFNAIAAFLGTQDFTTLLYIATTFSLSGAAFMYISSHNLMSFAKWFAIYMLVNSVMLGIKTSVEIIDVSNPMAVYQVDNIPIGLALPASLISEIGYGVTQDISDIFHTVDDVSYLHTGMLFGAKLFYTVTQGSQIQSSDLRQNMMDFTRQCILPDITINKKYTVQQLASTPDILGFLSAQSMSPLRGIYMAGAFQTCAAALPLIESAVNNESTGQQSWLGRLLNGDTQLDPAELQTQVGDVYSQMLGMSQTAQDTLTQNMMINALRQGIQTTMAEQDSTAGMLNYAETTGLQKQLLSDNTIARTAAYLIPLMQTVFFLLCVGVFPIIIVFSLQPWLFANMLKNYISSLVYLSLWSVLFVLLDFIMKTALSHYMTGLSIDQGGITLSNQNALLYEVEQFAGYAGYLMISVPLLAGFIFKGLQNTISSAAITMVGGMQSNLSSAAASAAEGNISLGNTSVGNSSWNNMSANKHDLNATNFRGMSTNQMADGSTISRATDGHTVLGMGGTISQTPISTHWSNSISQSASEQAAQHRSQASTEASSFNSSISAGSQAMTSLAHSQSNSTGSGNSWSVTDSAHVNEAIHNATNVAHQYAERHSISDQEANQILLQQSVHGKIGGSVGIKGFGNGATVESSISSDANMQKQGNSTVTGDYSDAHDFSVTTGYNKDISVIHDATQAHSYHANSEEAASALSSLSSHLDSAKQASTQWSSQLTQAENFDKLASIVKSEGAGFNQNLDQQYVEWMASKQSGMTMSERMQGVENVLHNDPMQARSSADQFVNEQTAQLANNFAAQSSHTASAASGVNNQVASQLHSSNGVISETGDASRSSIAAEATMNNLSFGHNNVDRSAQQSVETQISAQKNTIASGQAQTAAIGQQTEQNAQTQIKAGIKGNIEIMGERTGMKEDKLN